MNIDHSLSESFDHYLQKVYGSKACGTEDLRMAFMAGASYILYCLPEISNLANTEGDPVAIDAINRYYYEVKEFTEQLLNDHYTRKPR